MGYRRAVPRRIATLAALAACSGRGDDGRTPAPAACPALTVTIDDVPLPPLAHGLARANRRDNRVTYEIHVFDRPGATCAQLLDRSPRAVPAGEIGVRAFAGATGRGVAIGGWTKTGGNVALDSEAPRRAGDTVTLCVRDAFTFKPGIGPYTDKRVTVRGTFTGTYCGELDL
jgi:hypothetical protein